MNDAEPDPARLLARMEQWSRLLIRPPALVRQQIDAARRAYERGHLVVAGAEGAGKSTLINALLGADVAPTSRHAAGTVAPVYFRHAARHTPGYRVVYRSGEGGSVTSDVDREEFEQWLLQGNNPDNERGVLRGEVMINHPLLREGLQLVDMPGTGAMSSVVADETRAYLSGTAFTAVLVNQDSRIHALASVCRELQENQRDVIIAALVVNERGRDYLAPDNLDTDLKMLRENFRKSLLPKLPEGALGLKEAHIYVLHLLSLADKERIGPAHERHWQFFLDTVTSHVKVRGLAVASRACREALQSLDKALAARSGLLADLRADRITGAELAVMVNQAKAAARLELAALEKSEAATRPEHWRSVAAAAEQRAAQLAQLLDKHERMVSEKEGLPRTEAKILEEQLNEALKTASTLVTQADEETAALLANELTQVYRDIIAAYAASLPITRLPDPIITGETDATETGTYTFTGPTEFFRNLFHMQHVHGTFLFPITGRIAAVFPTTWIIVPAMHYAMGGNRGETLRQIRDLRRQILENLNADMEEGAFYQHWLGARKKLVGACSEMAEVALTQMGNEIMRPPAPELFETELERQQVEIDAARASLIEYLDASPSVYRSTTE